MQTTSVSLLDRLARSGENADWLRLTEIYRPFIQGVIRTYPGLASHADDVAQEVMLVLMRELPVFRRQRPGSFRAWLRGITVNQLRTALRKSNRARTVDDDASAIKNHMAELADPDSLAAKKWDEEHDRFVLEKVIDIVQADFKEQTWRAFILYAVEDRPAAKVAKQLDLSVNSVLLAKSRVLRRMREEAAGLVDD